jgi:hypothetical protein
LAGEGDAPASACSRSRFVAATFRGRARVRLRRLVGATHKAAELIDDLVRLEAAKGFLEKSTLIKRIIALPSLQEPPSNEKFTRLSTLERIHCREPSWLENVFSGKSMI